MEKKMSLSYPNPANCNPISIAFIIFNIGFIIGCFQWIHRTNERQYEQAFFLGVFCGSGPSL